jgi:hypothetical protein
LLPIQTQPWGARRGFSLHRLARLGGGFNRAVV